MKRYYLNDTVIGRGSLVSGPGEVLLLDKYAMVLIGGGVGALARYIAATIVTQRYGATFPWGTFVINVSGSFAIGVLMTVFTERLTHPYWRLLLVVGFLGGYTTFSSFEYETLAAVEGGSRWIGLLNVVGSVVCGYAAVWLGTALARRWQGL